MEGVLVVTQRQRGELWGEFEEIKALFVLRGIGEWVQLEPAVRALMELMVVSF